MQNGQNNGVGFFGIAVSSWCNSARGPGARNNGWFGRRVSSWCVSPRGPSYSLNLGASGISLARYFFSAASLWREGKLERDKPYVHTLVQIKTRIKHITGATRGAE